MCKPMMRFSRIWSRLPELPRLALNNTNVNDGTLAHIERLRNLTDLSLCDARIADAGLMHIEGLRKLRYLCLAPTMLPMPG